MDYSIVIPVFNREDLTQQCLATLRPTLEGAGAGEVIVVDNGSRPQTAQVLDGYPWVRVIRNEQNLGFAAACNQGARAAAGRMICHLNNDIVAQPRWLANMLARLTPDVGIVGARLLFADGRIQHAGVATNPVRFGPEGFGPHHIYWGWSGDTKVIAEPADFAAVTGACMLTPRALFLELGGFDEIFWNGYEDVDYCLRVGERGLRVVYEPSAVLFHYESQSGVQRKRRLAHNIRTLAARWGNRIDPDHNRYWARAGLVRRESLTDDTRKLAGYTLPQTTLVVHGGAPADPVAFTRLLDANRLLFARSLWFAGGPAPRGFELVDAQPLPALRTLLDTRSDHYFAFVDTRTELRNGWLDDLANAIEYGTDVVAATFIPEPAGGDVEPCASDARCSLVNLRDVPLHLRFGDVETIDGAIVDLTLQAVRHGLGVRAVRDARIALGTAAADAAFVRRYGEAHDRVRLADPARFERLCAPAAVEPTFASIVMLSWNAPQYTKMAVESIRAHTHCPYEIIIVDNGSESDTLTMLHALDDVRLIENSTNMGFAHGCNAGIAAARGTHVVLLNNDVVVTAGWLENLLAAHARDPLVGVSAPRSNRIVGHQQINGVPYDSLEGMHAFAEGRAREYAAVHYRTNRAIGFCLCISRAVIDEVGGIDPRYGIGNFEDDDFCIRVRAAGYQIVVCQDAFIHHFGSVTFAANNVDYASTMQKNWRIFAARWGLPAQYPAQGYNAALAISCGFVRARDYVALPSDPATAPREPAPVAPAHSAPSPGRTYDTAFVAVVDGEAGWSRVGPVVTNYIKALSVDDSTLFAIGVTGDTNAATIGGRIARSIERLKLDDVRVADIDVADIDAGDLHGWLQTIPAAARLRVAKDERLDELELAADRSPSGLARAVRAERQ